MLPPFELRRSMGDLHLLTAAWRFLQPLLFGQVRTNKPRSTSHYDIDPDFFLSFLDPKTPCYTQGVYTNAGGNTRCRDDQEVRLLLREAAAEAGDHILEVGPGWGAWFEYASRRGIKCTGITHLAEFDRLSEASGEGAWP